MAEILIEVPELLPEYEALLTAYRDQSPYLIDGRPHRITDWHWPKGSDFAYYRAIPVERVD